MEVTVSSLLLLRETIAMLQLLAFQEIIYIYLNLGLMIIESLCKASKISVLGACCCEALLFRVDLGTVGIQCLNV